MLEIEVKCPVADFGPVVERLVLWGARAEPMIEEADHYFNAPDRDFARTDEALRIRRVGPANRITYKGPKQPGITKTRREIEVSLASGEEVAEHTCSLFEHLGYRPTAVVRKRRTEYRFLRVGFDVACCLDDVDQVGRFVEVEIVVPDAQRGAAQAILLELCKELGLESFERRSYLELLLEKLGRS